MDAEIGTNESVGAAVVRAVCAVEGREVHSLRPLAEVVDPESLDALFATRPNGEPRVGGQISLVYSHCRVTVDNGEYLTIEPLDRHAVARRSRESS